MTAYTLTQIPILLWRAFKAKSAAEGKSMRDKLLELVREYVQEEESGV